MIDQTFKQNIENVISSSDDLLIIKSLDNLFDLYLETINSIDPELKSQRSLLTPNGIAIAPFDALHCFKDYWRTTKYLKGTYKAIASLLERFPNEELNLIDAGCGPIAPLVLPLLALFPNENIKVTLIDFHSPSLEIAQKVYEILGLKDFIGEPICDNAATIDLPSEKKYHLASVEAIMPNLIRESQVAITFNLGRQLEKNGIFIPEEIDIQAKFLNMSEEISFIQQNHTNLESKCNINKTKLKEFRYDLNTIFKLDLDLVKDFKDKNPNVKFPSIINTEQVIFPDKLPPNHYNFILEMKIKVYDDIEINSYESGLTHPMVFVINEPFGSLKGLQFVYNVLPEPGFSYMPIMKEAFA